MGDPRDNPGLWRPEYSKAFAALRFGGEDREEAARLLDAVEAAARAATLRAAAAEAETFRGAWPIVAAWLRAAADDPERLAAAGQAPAPQCPACGHGQHTGPCTVLVGHVSRITPAPCGCGLADFIGPSAEHRAAHAVPAPQPETAPDACVRCGHTAAEHGPRGCTVTAGPNRCGCPRDAAGAGAYWPLIDPGAARWVEHGTTWTRDEYGNTHSEGPATAPDAEPGTADLERYRRALAEANDYDIVDLEPHDYLDEARAVLAVRDDALTTAQQRAEAAEQRITAAAALHQRRDDHDGPYCGAGCGDWPCATTTALTPASAQDGDAT